MVLLCDHCPASLFRNSWPHTNRERPQLKSCLDGGYLSINVNQSEVATVLVSAGVPPRMLSLTSLGIVETEDLIMYVWGHCLPTRVMRR